ncbi:MAG: hypothetical protein AAF628_21750 [Planctomycetota bacterium]
MSIFFSDFALRSEDDYTRYWDSDPGFGDLIDEYADVVEGFYIEELYAQRPAYFWPEVNQDLATVGAFLESRDPEIPFIYAEADWVFASPLASAIDIPADVDWLGFEAWYPMSLPPCWETSNNQLDYFLQLLDQFSKPNQRFFIAPPSNRIGSPTSVEQANVLDCYLDAARKDPRFAAIVPWYYEYPLPPTRFGTIGLAQFGATSGCRRKFEALGAAFKVKEFCQLDLGGETGAGKLEMCDAVPFECGRTGEVVLSGAAPMVPAVLMVGDQYLNPPVYLPSLGVWAAVGGSVVSIPAQTDAQGGLAAPDLSFVHNCSGAAALYFQLFYPGASGLLQTNTLRVLF